MNIKTLRKVLLGVRVLLIAFLIFICALWLIMQLSGYPVTGKTHGRILFIIGTLLVLVISIAIYSRSKL